MPLVGRVKYTAVKHKAAVKLNRIYWSGDAITLLPCRILSDFLILRGKNLAVHWQL